MLGDPKKNPLLSQMAEAIPKGWRGAMRKNPMIFKSRKEAEEYLLDNLRANELKSYYWEPPEEVKEHEEGQE